MKGPNVRTKTIKLLEENKGTNLCEHEFVSCFLHMIPKPQATVVGQQKVNWKSSKLKTFELQKTPSRK